MDISFTEEFKYMQKELSKHGKLLARIDERTDNIMNHLDIIDKNFTNIDKKYVTNEAFAPYKRLIWLIMGVILSGAIVSTIYFL